MWWVWCRLLSGTGVHILYIGHLVVKGRIKTFIVFFLHYYFCSALGVLATIPLLALIIHLKTCTWWVGGMATLVMASAEVLQEEEVKAYFYFSSPMTFSYLTIMASSK